MSESVSFAVCFLRELCTGIASASTRDLSSTTRRCYHANGCQLWWYRFGKYRDWLCPPRVPVSAICERDELPCHGHCSGTALWQPWDRTHFAGDIWLGSSSRVAEWPILRRRVVAWVEGREKALRVRGAHIRRDTALRALVSFLLSTCMTLMCGRINAAFLPVLIGL